MLTDHRRWLIYLGAILVALICVPSCAQPEPPRVRIGYLLGDLHHLPFFVALEKGFFKDESINVEIIGPFEAGTAEMDAMAANQLDVGYVGVAPTIIAAARKVDLSIISGVNLEGSALVADPALQSVSELKSKKIATPQPGSIQYVMTGMLLSGNRLTYKDVELFPGTVKPPEMPLALETHRIDGYFVWEPFVAKSVVGSYGKVLAESKDIWPGHPCCVVVTRNDFKLKNEKTIASIIKVHQRAVKFISDNPSEAKAIAAKFTRLDEKIVAEAMKRVKYTATVNPADVKRFVTEIISLGESGAIKPIISVADVPDTGAFVDKLIDPKYTQR
jgi:NitT/TauT family transport system substrate-binding protein